VEHAIRSTSNCNPLLSAVVAFCWSCEVVAAGRVLSEGRAWVVRGNNDDIALAAWWNLQQGIIPPLPKLQWVGQLLPEDVQFLMDLPFSLTVEG
jgi:hypothetical protein